MIKIDKCIGLGGTTSQENDQMRIFLKDGTSLLLKHVKSRGSQQIVRMSGVEDTPRRSRIVVNTSVLVCGNEGCVAV